MTRRWGATTLLAALVVGAMVLAPAAAAAVLAVANDDQYSTPFETRLEVDEPGFLGNDLNVVGSTDPEITNQPDHGELNLKGNDGRFEYRPDDGFSGVDTFTYRLTTLLIGSTSAKVTITVGPKPTPTPSPTPKPTATPSPTPAPTPTPTPRPTPTPTPRPSILVLPSLDVPLPSIQILPTPTPSRTPPPTAGPTSSPTPTPSAGSSTAPTASSTPGAIAAVGSTGGGTGGPAASTFPDAAPVFDLPAAQDDGLSSSVSIDTGLAIPPTFLVPTLAFTVPGLLLILAVIAQGVGALAWIPFVRRTLGDDEPDRRRRRARAAVRR